MSAAAQDHGRDDFLALVEDIWVVLDEIAGALDGQLGDDPDES